MMTMAWFSVAQGLGATGARLIGDLNPGTVGSYPSNLTTFGGTLYFSAYTLETGFELFKYDGTRITLTADINSTADDIGGVQEGNDSLPAWLTGFGAQLYFAAYTPQRGAELWRYDGSQAVRVSDINPDANDAIKPFPNSAWPYGLTAVGDSLYFAATSSAAPENYELWQQSGAGVRQVANLRPDSGTNFSSYPTGLTTFSGSLFFMADDGTHGWELWRHNGVETKMFDLNPGGADSSSYPKNFVAFNNEVYFEAFSAASGFEIWKTDGSSAVLAADVQPGAESSFAKEFIVYNGALYFSGFEAAHGFELRKLAGAEAMLAADINPAGDSWPKNLKVLGDRLVFAANDGEHGWELWTFNGATATLAGDLNPSGDSFPENFTIFNGVLYFTATTPDTGHEIWKFDGQGISLAAEMNPGPGDSYPRFLTVLDGNLYFSAADDGTTNWELFVLETTAVNQPPTALLTLPASGATFFDTETITFSANATDDRAVTRVEFYAGAGLLGSDDAAPYTITATLPAGIFSVTAKAFDAENATVTSENVTITVREADPSQRPRISGISRIGQSVTVTVDGSAGLMHALQASADLQNWVTIDTKAFVSGSLSYTDLANEATRFYRIMVQR
jgi:ELWxxDGT repeat protein